MEGQEMLNYSFDQLGRGVHDLSDYLQEGCARGYL